MTAFASVALMVLVTFYQNTDFVTGTPGMNQIYFAPLDTFGAGGVPDPPVPGGSAGASFVAGSGGFVFNSGKGFIDMKNDLLKGAELEWKSVGDPSAPGTEAMIKGRTLGMTPQLLEQFNLMLGVPGIWLIKDTNCAANQFWVVGCDCNPGYFTFDFKTGAKGGNDAKGTNFEVKSICPPYSIVITPSDLTGLLLS